MSAAADEIPESWKQWLAEREEARRRALVVDAAFPGPYRRERPRDQDEADLLRRVGTPAHLIGPAPGPTDH